MPEGMTPEERAELIRRVAVLSDKLDVSEKQQAETDRIAKESHEAAEESARTATRQKWYTRGLLLLMVVVAFFVNEQREDGKDLAQAIEDIQDSREQQCINGNQTREGQRRIWEFYFEVTRAGGEAQGAPQSVLDFYDDFLAWITDEVWPDRDCSDLSKEYPPAGPPPSFEKALKEALEQDAKKG